MSSRTTGGAYDGSRWRLASELELEVHAFAAALKSELEFVSLRRITANQSSPQHNGSGTDLFDTRTSGLLWTPCSLRKSSERINFGLKYGKQQQNHVRATVLFTSHVCHPWTHYWANLHMHKELVSVENRSLGTTVAWARANSILNLRRFCFAILFS